MNCTICNTKITEVKFVLNGYNICHCVECGHLYTDFVPTQTEIESIYSDNYFFNGGTGYDDYTLEKDMLIKRGEYYAKKMTRFLKTGKVLDIGAAAGFILKGFENKGWEGIGIEPNKTMVDYGNKNLVLNLKQGTIETVILENKFDLIILIQVIAHISDLSHSMNKISELLNPGGHVLIETWDKDSFTSRIFGKYWHEYSPPSTLNYFSKKTLKLLMTQQGFSRIDQGIPKKSIHSRHAKSLISHKISESKKLKWLSGITKLIPGNMIIPYPSEDLFWALYKKNQTI